MMVSDCSDWLKNAVLRTIKKMLILRYILLEEITFPLYQGGNIILGDIRSAVSTPPNPPDTGIDLHYNSTWTLWTKSEQS